VVREGRQTDDIGVPVERPHVRSRRADTMSAMDDEQHKTTIGPVRPSDPGLRRLLTYTFIALIVSVLLAFLAVSLVIRLFDPGS